MATGIAVRCRRDARCRQCTGKRLSRTFWSSFNKARMSHLCDSTFAGPTARRDNVLASKMRIPPFPLPPFKCALTGLTSRFSPSLIHSLCAIFPSNSRFMRLFQAPLDSCLGSPFVASLSVHGLHLMVYASKDNGRWKSAPPSGTLLDFLLRHRHSLLEFC